MIVVIYTSHTCKVHEDSDMGFNEWAFLTTHNWGETSEGEWTLAISKGYRAGEYLYLLIWQPPMKGVFHCSHLQDGKLIGFNLRCAQV